MINWYYEENKMNEGNSYHKFDNSNNILKLCYFAFCDRRPSSHFILDKPKENCCHACDLMTLYKNKKTGG